MRIMKKALAALLAVAMVVTGLYIIPTVAEKVEATDESWTTADQVPVDMLDVKVQTANDGSVMRLITSVNSLDYYKVGFKVTPEGSTTPIVSDSKTVYERIQSTTNSVQYEFSPKVVDTTSEYFATVKMNVVDPELDYTVQAFVILRDGTTEVCGTKRCVSANDGASVAPLNLSFENTSEISVAKDDKLDITYTTDDKGEATAPVTEGATVIGVDGTTVHVRVNVPELGLKSATKFTFAKVADEVSTTVGSEIYRNLYTEYRQTDDEGTVTGKTADTSWYHIYRAAGETEFTIASDADLYGFSSLSENTFLTSDGAKETLYLVSDIEANSGVPTDKKVASWTTYATNAGNSLGTWTAVGTSDAKFQGAFEGQGHTISGIYLTATAANQGLFGYANNAEIKNVKLEDSFFTSAAGQLASVVGYGYANFENVYSNALVVSSSVGEWDRTSGIIAQLCEGTTSTMKNVWFDGVVENAGRRTAGLVARATLQTVFENCLFTGSINTTYATAPYIGGMIGEATNVIVIQNSLAAGTVTCSATNTVNRDMGVGASTNKLTITNSYVTTNMRTDDTYYGVGHKVSGTIDGSFAVTGTAITGYDGAKVEVDFVGEDGTEPTWALRKDGTPAPKTFVETALVVPDVEWAQSTEVEGAFEISSIEELAGVAWKVNGGDATAQSATYVLTDDISLNSDYSATWDDYAPEYEWVAIGTSTSPFKGTFYGKEKTIDGIYLNNVAGTQGLFGKIAGATIQDLRLKDSYFRSEGGSLGSIAGNGYGTLKNIYSNADVVEYRITAHEYGSSAGFIGYVAEGNTSIENCWFDGTIDGIGGMLGGLVGRVYLPNLTINITNTLNTAEIDTSYSPASTKDVRNGGICGHMQSGTLNIVDCVNAGTLFLGMNANKCGTVIGNNGGTIKVEDVYASTDVLTLSDGSTLNALAGSTITGTISLLSDDYGTGLSSDIWDTTTSPYPTLKHFVGIANE